MKGADVVMTTIVQYNDWLEEEVTVCHKLHKFRIHHYINQHKYVYLVLQTGNMAREGLRTLVVAKKTLTEDQYNDFEVLC